MPTKYSFPALRQYLATPVICSHRPCTLSLEPTPIGVLVRMQAPPADLSSTHAETACGTPFWSAHDASTTIITAVRGSGRAWLMPDLSAKYQISSTGGVRDGSIREKEMR